MHCCKMQVRAVTVIIYIPSKYAVLQYVTFCYIDGTVIAYMDIVKVEISNYKEVYYAKRRRDRAGR